MNVRLLFTALSLSVVASVACGSSDSGGSTPKSSTIAEACSSVGAAVAEADAKCLGAIAEDVTTATANIAASCDASAAAPGSGESIAAIDACTGALGGVGCSDLIAGRLPAACRPVGTLANGAACGDGTQCSSGFCAAPDNTCGVCAAAVAAGGACVNNTCPPGLDCNGGVCAAPTAAGAGCTATTPCGGGLACIGGVCGTAAAGAQCDHPGDLCNFTDPSICNEQNVCEKLTLAAPGAACGIVQKIICGGGASCTQPSMGTCQTPVALGGACNATDTCASSVVCTGGICAAFDPATCK